MKWTDLVNNEINNLVEQNTKLKKRLDKIRDNDSIKEFNNKVSLMAEIKANDTAIFKFHVLLGKSDQVDE